MGQFKVSIILLSSTCKTTQHSQLKYYGRSWLFLPHGVVPAHGGLVIHAGAVVEKELEV